MTALSQQNNVDCGLCAVSLLRPRNKNQPQKNLKRFQRFTFNFSILYTPEDCQSELEYDGLVQMIFLFQRARILRWTMLIGMRMLWPKPVFTKLFGSQPGIRICRFTNLSRWSTQHSSWGIDQQKLVHKSHLPFHLIILFLFFLVIFFMILVIFSWFFPCKSTPPKKKGNSLFKTMDFPGSIVQSIAPQWRERVSRADLSTSQWFRKRWKHSWESKVPPKKLPPPINKALLMDY